LYKNDAVHSNIIPVRSDAIVPKIKPICKASLFYVYSKTDIEQNRGTIMIVLISGGSGTGKTTLMKGLKEKLSGEFVRSYMTRAKRASETDEDGFFVTKEELEGMKDLMWSDEIHDNFYAFALQDFKRAVYKRKMAIAILHPNRHVSARRLLSDVAPVIHIHLLKPSDEQLQRRLSNRNISKEELQKRLQDSEEFDRIAQDETDIQIHFIKPSTKENVLQEVLDIIQKAK